MTKLTDSILRFFFLLEWFLFIPGIFREINEGGEKKCLICYENSEKRVVRIGKKKFDSNCLGKDWNKKFSRKKNTIKNEDFSGEI